ncbi:MAG TPA: hypothetical protein VGH33_23725, partial [Isosphaeraceae bacterium]
IDPGPRGPPAERSRSGRRARSLRTAAVFAAAALAAVAVWRFAASARPDPFLVPGRHATAIPGGGS